VNLRDSQCAAFAPLLDRHLITRVDVGGTVGCSWAFWQEHDTIRSCNCAVFLAFVWVVRRLCGLVLEACSDLLGVEKKPLS